MCKGRPIIARCACGASFAECDFVEAMLHITPNSSKSHKWEFIEHRIFRAGRYIPGLVAYDHKEYLRKKKEMK